MCIPVRNIQSDLNSCSPYPAKVHMIGIGGVGMYALARLLSEAGSIVTGSDAHESEAIKALRNANIHVSVGHDAKLVDKVDTVIYSPAIPKRNPELAAACEQGIPTMSRAEAVAGFLRTRKVVCVAGSHGKTTTTAMLALILEKNGFDPGYMVGGFAASLNQHNARVGTGPFALEACEAFGALRWWTPDHCIITNIDDEHSEHYGQIGRLRGAFQDLIGRTPLSGIVAVCGDDNSLANLCCEAGRAPTTYGLGEQNAVRAEVESLGRDGSTFFVYKRSSQLGQIALKVPGEHNICNALGAIVIAEAYGVSFDGIACALGAFTGVERRCQFVGEARGVRVLDDYAHHPTEIKATLSVAATNVEPGGRLIVALEPQLHSRVGRMPDSFASVLSAAHEVILLPIDAAGESVIEPADTILTQSLRDLNLSFTQVTTPEQAAAVALQKLSPGDTLACVGPGKVSQISNLVLNELRSKERAPLSSLPRYSSVSCGPTLQEVENRTLLDHFYINVSRQPHMPAVECGLSRLSYSELDCQARALKESLLRRGCRSGDVIAVRLDYSVRRIVAFLGIMMAEATYLPIDSTVPEDRVRFILADASVKTLICDDENAQARAFDVPVFALSSEHSDVPLNSTLERSLRATDVAYIVYTSGTTGTPKGVVVEHASLLNVAHASAQEFNIDHRSRVSQVSSFGFDIAIGDMAMALYAGACLVIPANSYSAHPGSPLGAFIRDSATTHLSITPSALSAVPCWDYPALSHIIVCGEKCPDDLAARWLTICRFFNAYGPAEATVWCTAEECLPGNPVTIGSALPNVEIYILDADRKVVPYGIPGEIWISGKCLARGYLNRPELSEERFSRILIGEQWVRAYMTGDLATMTEEKRIHFLGRADDQVKLRGYRIELSEVEAALRRHPAIQDAIVDVRKDLTGADRIVAYVVAAESSAPSHRDISDFLVGWLPGYMMPSVTVQIDSIPFNQNRKRDRKAPPAPWTLSAQSPKQMRSARSIVEKELVAVFRKALSFRGQVSIRDTFTELGLDSLQTANLFLAVESQCNIQLPEHAFTDADTIELLAVYVEKARSENLRAGELGTPSLIESILRKQRPYLAAWTGSRIASDSLIYLHNKRGQRVPLFWCFQGNQEHEALASRLGDDQPVYGMRSGHLIFRYTEPNVRALAGRYVDEMIRLQPFGSFRIGGNCQGGFIAREIALELRSRGREVEVLYLLDQGRFLPYDGRVILIFGAESDLNPYRLMADPDRIFRAAYGTSYAVSVIPGTNDKLFIDPSISSLAATIEGISNPATQP